MRMDVHTCYHQDYVLECVTALRRTGAACVGGPWVALGENGVQKAITLAFQSQLISGGAQSRMRNYTGYVDTVYLGAWNVETLRKIGGFDERFVRNQDDELCLRLRNSGLKIFQDSKIKCWYYPRSSFVSLFKQYFQYGYWKPLVFAKHKQTGALRHKILISGIVLNFCLILLSLTNLIFGMAYLLIIACYLSLIFVTANLSNRDTENETSNFLISVAMVTMHFSYGLGLVYGAVDKLILKNRNGNKMTSLSR